ncbi:MAG: ABC transporter ATP-binding protein [Parachlamydia sp.]|jgi:iron complex transport system ATP-binding protein|nr:ABC transporter ATP-binding protein [Parachlamydia sp.]
MDLHVKNLSLHYKGKEGPQMTHCFERGKITALLGPNGSGKTTLLKTLAGLQKAASGTVEWNGLSLLQLARKALSGIVSLVPQNPLSFFDYTVEEMVHFGLYSRSKPLDQEDVFELTDIKHLRTRMLSTLSGGEKQRVYTARSLITGSPIILLDEPASNLDIRHQIEIWTLLRHLAQRDKKVIVVALHDWQAGGQYCDNAIILQEGEMVAAGMYKEVFKDDILKNVFGVKFCSLKGTYVKT